MKKNNNQTESVQKITIVVPIISLSIYNPGIQNSDNLSITHSLELPSIAPDNIYFVRFSKKISLLQLNNSLKIKDDILLPTPLGKININNEDTMSFDSSINFQCAFVLNYYNKQDNGVCIFPSQIENLVIEQNLILKLFSPGNIFLPTAFINEFGAQEINHNNLYQKNENDMTFSVNEIEKFKIFYLNYWNHLQRVKEKMKDENKKIVSWSKRINNGLYFFNQIYFSRKSNTLSSDSRVGNELRLIYLITALDALIGCSASGKELAKNCYNALGGYFPKIKERIEYFYQLRSNYIHANDEKMVSHIKDEAIQELQHYVQKLILLNLRLLNSKEFLDSFIKSNKKHYFLHLEKNNSDIYYKKIIDDFKKLEGMY